MRPRPAIERKTNGIVHARQEFSNVYITSLATAASPGILVTLNKPPYVYGEDMRVQRLQHGRRTRRHYDE